MKKDRKIKRLKGYTLIEAIVSLAIIAMITTIFTANYQSANRNTQLNLAAQQLASDIRRVQNYTLGLKEDKTGVFPPGGWGIFFLRQSVADKKHYRLFADLDFNHYYDGVAEESEDIELPAGVTIDDIIFDGTGRTRGAVTFIAPDPDTYFCRLPAQCDNEGSNADVFIIRLINDSGLTKDVLVNSYGLIDVN